MENIPVIEYHRGQVLVFNSYVNIMSPKRLFFNSKCVCKIEL